MKREFTIFTIFIFIAFIFWGAITLSEEYITSLSIPVKIILPEPSYAVEGEIPEFLNVKVKTIGWELLKLRYFQKPTFEFIINEPRENFVFDLNTISNEQLNLSSTAKIISIKPEVIKLNFNLSVEKKVKIFPRVFYTIKDNYDIVSPIKVEPESILIRGTKKVVSRIDSLPTEIVHLSQLSEFTSVETRIADTLRNIITYDKIPVKISFDVQQIVDRDFEKIPIELVNLPSNKEIVIFPSFINLKLRGGISILGSLSSDSLKAIVDYKKISMENDADIIPEFQIPFGVKVIDYFPKQFKLIYRK